MTRTLVLFVFLGICAGGSVAQPPQAGPEFRVHNGTAGNQSNPRVAVDAAGNFLVVWSGDQAAGQRFDDRGRRRGGEVLFSSAPSALEVGMNGAGDFVAIWNDPLSGLLSAGAFTPAGAARGDAFQLKAGGYWGTAVETSRDGSFVVAWSEYGFGYSNFSVERFDRGGRSMGVLSRNNNSYDPAMAMSATGDFILVTAGFSRSIDGQRFDRAGNAVGPSFRVDRGDNPFPGYPSIAMAPNGSFLVTWQASSQPLTKDVYVRRFDSAAAPVGEELKVNVYEGSWLSPEPDVAIGPDGSALVVWSIRRQDGDETDVFGRRFDSAGAPLGTEFQINSFTSSNQSAPSVAFDARGNAVVAWQSLDQDGSGFGIFAKRYPGVASSIDTDGDGVKDPVDNCPTVPNADQADAGSDQRGDACVAPDVVLHPTALLGANPIISQGSVIAERVTIGDDVRIGERVTVSGRVRIGHRVTIDDDTRIDPGATIGEAAAIGDGVTIERNAVVGPRAMIGPLVVLETGARIGRAAKVETGARVGRRTIVRPGAVVPAGTSVPAGATFP